MHRSLLLVVALAAVSASAQWTDVKKLGIGGESYVSTDGHGHVYATCHLPCQLFSSSDYGAKFATAVSLPNSFCDVASTVAPDGRLYVSYLVPGVKGVQIATSVDKGLTLEKGALLEGSFDREWVVVDPMTKAVGVDYSNGYIGGPKSKGVFYAASTDEGKTFEQLSRVDHEPDGQYAVDPYLTIGSKGRLYAGWAVSTDYNRIDRYMFAASDDGGKTWHSHTQIGATSPALGDTQERWMLGSFAATGPDTVFVFYQNYAQIGADKPLLVFYRVSTDGGQNWSKGQPATSMAEIKEAIAQFKKGGGAGAAVSNYVQTLPWASADPSGRLHLAFVDNREGKRTANGKKAGAWHVRYASLKTLTGKWTRSERVSKTWTAGRPPLDFIGCAADGKYVYITWDENAGHPEGMDFSGDLYLARKANK